MKAKSIIKSYWDSILLIIGMVAGGIIGVIWGPGASALTPIADVFLNLMFCIVVPLVYVSIVTSIANLKSGKEMSKLMVSMFAVFIITQLIAALLSGGIIGILEPARGAILPSVTEEVEVSDVSFNILSQVTVGDFSLLWSRGSLLALVIFALLSGVALRAVADKAPYVITGLNQLNQVIMKMVAYIMKLGPIGLGAYFAAMIGQFGGSVSGPMAKMVIVTWIYAFIYMFTVGPLFSWIGAGKRGVSQYLKFFLRPAVTALGTCSSAAGVPVNIQVGKEMGISDDVNSVVMPLGCNLHKEGACLIVMITISLECSLLGLNFFDPKMFMTAVAAALIGSMITGAIPTGGNVIIMLVIPMFGFPAETIPLIILLHTLVDGPTTMLNVVGDLSSALTIDNRLQSSRTKLQVKGTD